MQLRPKQITWDLIVEEVEEHIAMKQKKWMMI
jgi:hypothetical protein